MAAPIGFLSGQFNVEDPPLLGSEPSAKRRRGLEGFDNSGPAEQGFVGQGFQQQPQSASLDYGFSAAGHPSGRPSNAGPGSGEVPKLKTKLCQFFEQGGNCSRGALCWYAHGTTELNTPVVPSPQAPVDSKSKICTFWEQGVCTRGSNCWFAHGQDDLQLPTQGGAGQPQQPPPDARYKLCAFFQQGTCQRGAQCWYAHGEAELLGGPGSGGSGPPPMVIGAPAKMCLYIETIGRCHRGEECWFAHTKEELEKGIQIRHAAQKSLTPATQRMDFSVPSAAQNEKAVTIPPEQIRCLMTDATRELVMQLTGISEVRWEKQRRKAILMGSAAQVEKAASMLQRVSTHCLWGISEPKVRGLLRPPQDATSVRLRLSPMMPTLKEANIQLNIGKPVLTIGTDASCGLRLKGPSLSRNHAQLEFQPEKGAVYIADTSTNGTFLNGKRLPAKGSAKVVLWHGDELLFQDPQLGGGEFGYVVNLEML
eukprot:TRINITY_DN49149_c0_g1_i1.p1 TRINITY_DN49149_c0_g1~~TRINITY_DN49149_c0_g1_i1.p1  ORF type:complete len:503 (+),score=81.72 TRINITY_DN49149_c0_g1_i1:72-1511(+)